MDRDTSPREVEIPPGLLAAFERDAAAKTAFDKLSFTHRKEYANWISEAKKEETRERRVAKALVMLKEGATLS